MKDFQTLSELILFQSAKFHNSRALNFKEGRAWRSFSNQEFLQKSFYFACALKEMGFQNNQIFANFSYQNPIWLIVDFGVILAGGVSVPLFHNISKENLFYQIDDCNAEFVFVDNKENLANLVEKKVKNIISYNFDTKGVASFDDMILLGEKVAKEKKYELNDFAQLNSPQDLVTIIYTSGSTGRPKGVELTHANLVSQIKATAQCFPLDAKTDKAMSFLPLAHIFERMVMMFYITQGIEIYFTDDVKNLGNLLREVKPTLMTVVPRMLEKTFAKIKDGAESAGFLKKILARAALNRALTKNTLLKKNIVDRFLDVVVYKKFRQGLGGNMRMLICGGAALSLDMEKFYENIGVNLYCGYGLTETSPVLAVNFAGNHKFATVGRAFPGVELKIAPDQELLARGPGVMRGYHNLAQKTAETFVDDWFKTGDLAQIDEDGFLKITGRKKELFKTATGKYVRPIPIEQKLMQELGFALGTLIIAEGKKFVSSLIFPDFELIEKFKKSLKFQGSNEDFLVSEILHEFVADKIETINESLDHWEQIRKFSIITNEISIETGEITPSMKLKRSFLEEKYKDMIEGFYQD